MLRSASRLATARTGRDVREPDAQSRLALVEGLLASLDLESSVQCALDWLGRHCDVRWSACLVRDAQGRVLVPVGDGGRASAAWTDITLYVDERAHPLVRALWADAPSYVSAETSRFWPPLSSACYAIPLRSSAQAETNDGVLVVSAEAPRLRPDVRWAAGVLGDQIFRLRSREVLADTRFGRERTLLHGIVNAVTDPILLTDTEGKLLLANAAAERLFTAPDDASEGWRQAVALNNMLFSAALSGSAVQPDAPTRGELVLVDPFEGSDLLAELLSASLLDTREGTAIVSVLRNVTDLGRASRELEEGYRQLRTAQEEARDQRRRLELIIDSVADPILVTDPASDIVLMNARAEHFFRVASATDADAVDRRIETNTARFSSFLSTLLSSGAERGWRGEMTLVDPGSETDVPMEAIAGTVTSQQGELVWVVTILHDRTEELERARLFEELKRASEELEAKVQAATVELADQNELLRRQRAEVEQASELKSRFLANMSHEFRTPLNAILGYTQMLLHGVAGRLTDEQKPNLERIDSNARHLLALINDILDLSRIEAGQMPLHLSDVDVRELVAEVLAELQPIVERSRLDVTKHVSRRLPTLRTDRPKVKQILLNLLSNALKFTRRGSVRVVAAPLAEGGVSVTVRDTGIGIAPSDLAGIFEDFRQLDMSPSRGHGGTGLGLAISRRLALILGGKITVESQVGRGSAFTVLLPARPRPQ